MENYGWKLNCFIKSRYQWICRNIYFTSKTQQSWHFLQNVISRILCYENENYQFLKNNFFLVSHSHLLMILHWLLMKSMIFGSFGLWWPFLAFIGLFGLCDLGWFFKAKTGLCWWKLSIIDLLPTIRCQKQSPNEIGHFESVCRRVDRLPTPAQRVSLG